MICPWLLTVALAASAPLSEPTKEPTTEPATAPVSAATAPGLPYPRSGVDTPPKPIHQPPPTYPIKAAIAGIEGRVTVEMVVTETGKVARAKVLKSIPLLDAAAVATALEWRFEPARKEGRAVESIVHGVVGFQLLSPKRPTLSSTFLVPPARTKERAPKLLEKLGHTKPVERTNAALKLANLPDATPEVLAALTSALHDPEAAVRNAAALALFARNRIAPAPSPQVLYRRVPDYVEALRKQKVEGDVEMELLVSDAGDVIGGRFVGHAARALDQAALLAASHWHFAPQREDAGPRPFTAPAVFRFQAGRVEID
jgi:TonB family protein